MDPEIGHGDGGYSSVDLSALKSQNLQVLGRGAGHFCDFIDELMMSYSSAFVSYCAVLMVN